MDILSVTLVDTPPASKFIVPAGAFIFRSREAQHRRPLQAGAVALITAASAISIQAGAGRLATACLRVEYLDHEWVLTPFGPGLVAVWNRAAQAWKSVHDPTPAPQAGALHLSLPGGDHTVVTSQRVVSRHCLSLTSLDPEPVGSSTWEAAT